MYAAGSNLVELNAVRIRIFSRDMLRQVNVQSIVALLECELGVGAKQPDRCNSCLAQSGIQRMDDRLAARGISKLNGIKHLTFFYEAKIFSRIRMRIGIVERAFRHLSRTLAENLPGSRPVDGFAVDLQPFAHFEQNFLNR